MLLAWEVDVTNIAEWMAGLDKPSRDLVVAALRVLEDEGPSLGRPLVDTLRGSRVRNLKELRPGSSGRSELRVIFAFDTRRVALMLVAGDKRGNWSEWYRASITQAEELLAAHQARIEEG